MVDSKLENGNWVKMFNTTDEAITHIKTVLNSSPNAKLRMHNRYTKINTASRSLVPSLLGISGYLFDEESVEFIGHFEINCCFESDAEDMMNKIKEAIL